MAKLRPMTIRCSVLVDSWWGYLSRYCPSPTSSKISSVFF